MEIFITVNNKNEYFRQWVQAKKMMTINGVSFAIHGESGNWNVTELITGLSMGSRFHTIKSAIENTKKCINTMDIPSLISRQLDFFSKQESWLYEPVYEL